MIGLLPLLLLGVPPAARTECISWQGSDLHVDIEKAGVVFEGVVQRIDFGGTEGCEPDRVFLSVERVWKGGAAPQYVLVQENRRGSIAEQLPDGSTRVRGCPMSFDATIFQEGERYIVFASGPAGQRRSMGCSTGSATKAERRRLDRWKRSKAAGGK